MKPRQSRASGRGRGSPVPAGTRRLRVNCEVRWPSGAALVRRAHRASARAIILKHDVFRHRAERDAAQRSVGQEGRRTCACGTGLLGCRPLKARGSMLLASGDQGDCRPMASPRSDVLVQQARRRCCSRAADRPIKTTALALQPATDQPVLGGLRAYLQRPPRVWHCLAARFCRCGVGNLARPRPSSGGCKARRHVRPRLTPLCFQLPMNTMGAACRGVVLRGVDSASTLAPDPLPRLPPSLPPSHLPTPRSV